MADPINPSSLVYNGASVTSANPIPCSNAGSGASHGPDATILLNPRSLIVSGAPVTSANPLPIILV